MVALASWLRNEEIIAEEVKILLSKEMEEPLCVRLEHSSPHLLTSNHEIIEEDPNMETIYRQMEEEVILDYEDSYRLFSEEILHVGHRRWHTFSYSLRIKEYHPSNRLRVALVVTPLYKRII